MLLSATTVISAAESTTPPETFSLRINRFKHTASHVEVRALTGELLIRTSRGGRLLSEQTIKVPTEGWILFRKRIDDAKVWQWKDRYDNFAITDGTNWRLDLEWSGKKVSSAGQNAYPDYNAFRAVIAAIVELRHGTAPPARATK